MRQLRSTGVPKFAAYQGIRDVILLRNICTPPYFWPTLVVFVMRSRYGTTRIAEPSRVDNEGSG